MIRSSWRPAPGPGCALLSALVAAAVAGLAGPPPVAAQAPADPEAPTDPFAGFETHVLDNGLRLWIGRVPGAADVSVGALVPYGWDQDPRGKEELAHFTEHMLFGDHAGRTEEQILDEVESRGGRRNGLTTPDHTFYYVTLPVQHGLFGVAWLGRVLEPKAMDPAVVDRNRQPVGLEIGARPRQFLDHVVAALDPEWLRAPEYWEREFGLETRAARAYDRWGSLQRIGPDDLRDFYDRHYTPEAMTVVIVGDVDPGAALAAAEAAFGGLVARPAPAGYGPLTDPGRAFRSVTWSVRPNVRYQRVFKLYDLDRTTHVRLVFLARYLDRRLSMRLRFGEVKAVYGVNVQVVRRGPATHLQLTAPIDPDQWDYAMTVVDEELALLASGTTSAEDFEADRAALVERVRAENRESQDLVFWLHEHLYPSSLHPDFPDIAAAFAAVRPTDLEALVRDRLTPDRQGEWIARPQPLGQGALLVLALLLGVVTLRTTARRLVRPVDMRRIRYVARIKLSGLVLIVATTVYLAVGLVVGRLIGAAVERGARAWILPVDNWMLQSTVWALLGVAAMVLILLWLSLPPRKILLFDDHLRIKHLAFRSRPLTLEGLQVTRAGWRDVVRSGRLNRTLLLTMGARGRGVWIQPARGMGYLVRLRAPDEVVEAVASAQRRLEHPVEPG